MSEHFQMNTPQKEILCIKPDGSFRVGDGVDPMFALGELANAYMKQRERIKRLEEALDCVIIDCSFLGHKRKHRHEHNEPCLVEELIRKAKEAKP